MNFFPHENLQKAKKDLVSRLISRYLLVVSAGIA